MKNFKKLMVVVLICSFCFTLCACGAPDRSELVGTWSGAYVYNGSQYARAFVLSDDGSYTEVCYKDGSLYSTETGDWHIEGKKVILEEDGEPGQTPYKYKGGVLVNADHEFSKVS